MTRIGKVTPKYMTIDEVRRERMEQRPERTIMDSVIDIACWFIACLGLAAIFVVAMHYGVKS